MATDDKTFAQALSTSTFWVGLIASRLSYVLLHADAYLSNPLALIDIRDGGWHATGGELVGLMVRSMSPRNADTFKGSKV